MEKKDIHNIERQYRYALDSIERCKNINSIDFKRIKQFLDDCLIGKNSRKKVGKARLRRYLLNLVFFANYFKKPFSRITDKDTENFYRELQTNKIRRNDGKYYAANTKTELVKTLKKFGRWFYKDKPDKYQKLFGWLKDFEADKEIPALTKQEVEKLAKTSTPRDAALLMFMFDSGARAEELLNIRRGDLKEEQIGKDSFYKVRIRVSKTKPRTITVPLATAYLKNWLKAYPQKDDEFLFPIVYDYLRKILYRKGKILGKRIYPHLFRHSSATYYCNRLNQYQLCYRYGWAMSSKQPQRYIDREGIEEEKTAKIITTDEITRFREENEKLKEELIMLKTQYSGMETRLEEGFMTRLMLVEENQRKTAEQQEEMAKAFAKSGKKFDIVLPLVKESGSRR